MSMHSSIVRLIRVLWFSMRRSCTVADEVCLCSTLAASCLPLCDHFLYQGRDHQLEVCLHAFLPNFDIVRRAFEAFYPTLEDIDHFLESLDPCSLHVLSLALERFLPGQVVCQVDSLLG